MSELHAVGGRTPGSGRRAEVSEVLALLESRTSALPGEAVPLHESAGRVLSVAVVANVNVPGFAKSAMDGFAVCASDTTGASPDAPRTLAILGESLPARPFGGEVKPGQAVRILTGAPFPAGADAVLVSESATLDGTRVLAHEAVPPGKHVIRVGEDVAKGSVVLPSGRLLRPQDVGLLASIGVSSVEVVRRPRVAILVTGNELLPPGTAPAGFQIVDSNSPMLAALAARAGATVLPVRAAPDAPAAIRTASMSSPESVSSRTANDGRSMAICNTSARFFSPPENPSFRFRRAKSPSIPSSSIDALSSLWNSRIGTSSCPSCRSGFRMFVTAWRRKLATVTPGIAVGY